LLRDIHATTKPVGSAGAHSLDISEPAAKLVYRATLYSLGFA
jgi:hypothetical protein